MPEAGQARANRRDLGPPVDVPVAVAVAADSQQHHRLDLREAIDHAPGTELGRARRPHRAEAGGGDERGQRLGDVGHVGDDPIAGLHAQSLQPDPDSSGQGGQLTEGQLERGTRLRTGDNGDSIGVLAGSHEVLGVVQARAREPPRSRHPRVGEHVLVGSVGADSVELPHRGPEAGEVVDRPAPELVVDREVAPPVLAQPTHEAADLRARTQIVGRRPQDVSDHRSSGSLMIDR